MKYIYLICVMAFLCRCSEESASKETDGTQEVERTLGVADDKSAEIAERVINKMGGLQKWTETRFIAWNFFGARDLVWDKWTGNVRIDFPSAKSNFIVNVNSAEGKVWKEGESVTHPDSLTKYLSLAKSIWINDSYWLAMPFKLRDPGVTLSYIGDDTTAIGAESEVLELTFNEVGDTPENKYRIHVTKSDDLIKQWDFYRSAAQEKPSVVWPWDNYRTYDGILLSGDRSDGKGPKNIRVFKTIPDDVFEKLEYTSF